MGCFDFAQQPGRDFVQQPGRRLRSTTGKKTSLNNREEDFAQQPGKGRYNADLTGFGNLLGLVG